MRYRVRHLTRYDYENTVAVCHNVAHLKPRATPESTLRSHALRITPPARPVERSDFFGNPTACFSIPERHEKMTLEAISDVEVSPRSSPAPDRTAPWESVRDGISRGDLADWLDATQYLYDSRLVARESQLARFGKRAFPTGRPILEGALALNSQIKREIEYKPRSTKVDTTAIEALDLRRGVCQDLAHIFVGAMRSLGLPARYVSGYLRTRPAPGMPHRVGADQSHAWVSVYLGRDGWIDLDPTNDCIVRDEHVTLAWGRDYRDVAPLLGVFLGGGKQTLHVEVDVAPLDASAQAPVEKAPAPHVASTNGSPATNGSR